MHHFYNCVKRIKNARVMANFGKMLRIEYVHKVFDKERDFIAKFYEKKFSKSGKVIFSKITGISDTVQREAIVLYMLAKQKKFMVPFYQI